MIDLIGSKVLWLDQRGTGMSTPICGDLLDHLSDNEKADYIKNFRSDNIGEEIFLVVMELNL